MREGRRGGGGRRRVGVVDEGERTNERTIFYLFTRVIDKNCIHVFTPRERNGERRTVDEGGKERGGGG